MKLPYKKRICRGGVFIYWPKVDKIALMLRSEQRGFTTLEALLAALLIVVTGAAAIIYFNYAGRAKHLSPSPTIPPTTLSITKEASVNSQGNTSTTHKVTDTNMAAAILADIQQLPKATSSTCKSSGSAIYMLQFADPDMTYTVMYGGCYLINNKDKHVSYLADPNKPIGASFWSAIEKVLGGRP